MCGGAVRGGGGGAGGTDNAGRAEPGPGRSALSPLALGLRFALLSFPPLFLRDLRGGECILTPLGGRCAQGSDGRAAATFRGRCCVWRWRAPPAAPLCVPRASPVREKRGREAMAGWTLHAGTSVPEDARELKGAGPRGSRSRFPFLWGGSGSSPPELGPRWGQVVALRQAARSTSGLPLQVGLRSAATGSAAAAPVPPARLPGTTRHFVLVCRFICALFNFLSFPEKGKPNKRISLFLFRACKVEDI